MKIAGVAFLFCITCPRMNAQYGVTWPTQPSTPMATEVQPGPQTLRVSGVNDFLYAYDINVIEIETPIPPPNFSVGGLAGCSNPQIMAFQTDAQKAFGAYLKLFPDPGAPSRSLTGSQNDWKTSVKPAYDKLSQELSDSQAAIVGIADPAQKSVCQSTLESSNIEYSTLRTADQALNSGPHVAQATFQVKSCKSEILTVIEKYRGVPTGQSITVRLDAACDEFTVGGGVLLTELQNRTYSSAPLPNQAGQFLAVSGTGKFRPTFIALTSFNLPLEPLGTRFSSALGDVRLGISTGPVIQGSASNVSSLGWFVGGTLSFFHRLYISPGTHIGQFADFPPGFASLQQIPPGFGALTPNLRWTGRFSIAITVKGWDLSKTFKGGNDQPPVAKATK